MSHTSLQRRFLQRCALIGALLALAVPAASQAPAPAPAPRAPAAPPAAGAPARPGAASAAAQRLVNPHGNRQTMARVVPAPDFAPGEIEVRLSSNEANLIDEQAVKLAISKQSIEQGNTSSEIKDKTNLGGVVRFRDQATATDFIYTVTASVGGAEFSSPQFQFRAGGAGMRVLLPVYKASNDVNGILVLSRALFAIIPQDNLFAVDMLWRIENYSEMAWVPDPADKNLRYELPEGVKAIQIKEDVGDARFVQDGDAAIRLAGTFAPGQHDLMLRFHLDTDGKSQRKIAFPASVHLGSVRILLDSAPGMTLKVNGFPDPTESRNQDGQRRLIASRDFLTEKDACPGKDRSPDHRYPHACRRALLCRVAGVRDRGRWPGGLRGALPSPLASAVATLQGGARPRWRAAAGGADPTGASLQARRDRSQDA